MLCCAVAMETLPKFYLGDRNHSDEVGIIECAPNYLAPAIFLSSMLIGYEPRRSGTVQWEEALLQNTLIR